MDLFWLRELGSDSQGDGKVSPQLQVMMSLILQLILIGRVFRTNAFNRDYRPHIISDGMSVIVWESSAHLVVPR